MLVELVVDDVVEVEEILRRDVLVAGLRRRLRQIGCRQKVAVADGRAARIGRVVRVGVEIGVHVVAGDVDGALAAGEQPARRRFDAARRRTGDDLLRGDHRIHSEDVVRVLHSARFDGEHGAVAFDERVVEQVALFGPGFHEETGTHRAVGQRNRDARDGGIAVKERTAREDGGVSILSAHRRVSGEFRVKATERRTERLLGAGARAGHVARHRDCGVDDLDHLAG